VEVLSNLHQAGENEQAHVGGPVFRSAPNQPKMRALLVYMNKTETIENIFNYDWPSDEQLVDFAERSTASEVMMDTMVYYTSKISMSMIKK